MTIRTAILGYGRSGSTMHAGAIEHNEPFQMVAVCDIDQERRQQAADRFGCAVYDNYHRMLEQEDLDLVSVITRSDQHCRMTCDCLEAGANVLVTKPWAVNAAEGQRMVDAAKSTGQRLFPWLPARWGSVFRRLKTLIDADTIGDVFLIRRAVFSFATRCDWQIERRYGGGYLLNWGPHIVDPPVLLAGSPVKSAFGRLRQVINPGDGEDVFFAVLTLADGTIVQAEYSIAVEPLPEWFIQGDRGTIIANGKTIRICKNIPAQPDDPTRYGDMKSKDEAMVEETVQGAPYGDQNVVYAEVAEALQRGAPFAVAPEDALQLSKTLDAIRKSSETGDVVTL